MKIVLSVLLSLGIGFFAGYAIQMPRIDQLESTQKVYAQKYDELEKQASEMSVNFSQCVDEKEAVKAELQKKIEAEAQAAQAAQDSQKASLFMGMLKLAAAL